MISLTFVCDNGHETQALYSGNDKFQELLNAAMLECTACGQKGMRQGLSKPNVNTGVSRQPATEIPHNKPRDVGNNFYNTVKDMMNGRAPPEVVLGTASFEQISELQINGANIVPVPSDGKMSRKPAGKHLN